MGRKVERDLQEREAVMRELSFLQIGGPTGFFLLIASYIIIHIDIQRIRWYKSKAVTLIRQFHGIGYAEQGIDFLAQESHTYHYPRIAHTADSHTRLCGTDTRAWQGSSIRYAESSLLAAELIGIERTTLYGKMKKYGIRHKE